METDLNNLLVEETIEVIATWSTFQTYACKNTLPACFSARLCLTSLVSSYMSGGISHLSFQGRMTSSKVCLQAQAPQGALAGRLHRGPGNANAASASSHAAWEGIDQDPDRPKRNVGPPKRYSKTARPQAGHTTQQTGVTKDIRMEKTELGFFPFGQNIPEWMGLYKAQDDEPLCPIMSQLLITNDKCPTLGLDALPTSAQFTGEFGFLQHSAILA